MEFCFHMNEQFNYRRATLADANGLKNLALLAYGQYASVLGENNWAVMKHNLANETMYVQLLKQSACFVCESGGKIVGMVFLIAHGNPTAFFETDWAYIRLLGVDPAYEGKGIGKRLTQHCIDFAKETGEKTIALHTSEFQHTARYLYERLGFKKLKELELIYGKRYWLYTLNLIRPEQEITYHFATINDLDTLIDLRIQFTLALTSHQDSGVIQNLKEQLHSYFVNSFKNGTSIWYLAKYQKMAVGIGGLVIREQPGNFLNPQGIYGYIINMYTLPDFRRKGICGSILELLIAKAKRQGIKAFELHATKEGELVYRQHDFLIHNEPTYRRYIK